MLIRPIINNCVNIKYAHVQVITKNMGWEHKKKKKIIILKEDEKKTEQEEEYMRREVEKLI